MSHPITTFDPTEDAVRPDDNHVAGTLQSRDCAEQTFLSENREFVIEQLFNCALSDLKRIEELQGNTALVYAKTRERLEKAYMSIPWEKRPSARKNAVYTNVTPDSACVRCGGPVKNIWVGDESVEEYCAECGQSNQR